MTDYQSMKVPELKQRLTNLGLSSKGVKKELIERLEEYDQKSAGTEGSGEKAAPERKEREGSEQAVDYMQADEEPDQVKEKGDGEGQQEKDKGKEKEEEKEEEKEKEEKEEETKEGERGEKKDEISPKQDLSPKKRKGEGEAEDSDPKKQKLSEDPSHSEEAPQEKVTEQTSGSPEKSAPLEPESNTLYIKGFVRPFTNGAVKDFLSTDGEVTFLWMDRIKSFCYVTFSEAEAAAKTKERVHGVVWPEVTGKTLQVEYFEEEKALALSQASEGLPLIKKGNPSPGAAQPKLRTPSDVQPQKAPEKVKEKQKESIERIVEPRSTDSKIQVELASAPTPAPAPKAKTQKSLDDLFQKTKAKPVLYFLPLTEEQIKAKEERKKQREEERKKREEERKREEEERRNGGRPPQRSRSGEREEDDKRSEDSDREKD